MLKDDRISRPGAKHIYHTRKMQAYFLYNLLFHLTLSYFILVTLNRHFRRGGGFGGALSRLGLRFSASGKSVSGSIWVQALSVGEVNVSTILIETLKKELKRPVFLTTTTPTGFRTARRLFPDVPVAYFPIDLPLASFFFIRRFRPCLFISLETELWPNLLFNLNLKKIPAVLINGCLSPRSYHRYRRIRNLFAPILSRFQILSMRSDEEAEWIRELGAPPERVSATGSLKYDLVISVARRIQKEDFGMKTLPSFLSPSRERMKVRGKEIVFGSIHPEEEEMAIDISERLLIKHPDLKIVFGPRHLERSNLISILPRRGLKFQALSKYIRVCVGQGACPCMPEAGVSLAFTRALQEANPPYLILDVMGCLNRAYASCRSAFVGGSLTIFGDGGHNVLEPAAFGKPVTFGPYAWNFREEGDLLIQAGGAVLVNNPERLYRFFDRCLSEPEWAENIGQKGYQAICQRTGATQRSVNIIKSVLGAKI